MKKDEEKEEHLTETIVEPFNDVTDHNQKIMGYPNKAADLSSMPVPVRWFFYFVVGFSLFAFLTVVISALLN